jgi:hypothetical protein
MLVAGARAEQRFFSIVKTTAQEELPAWFAKIKKASILFDAGGVDFLVWVRRRVDGRLIKVPIQIKTNLDGVRNHMKSRPDHWLHRVIVISMNDRSDEEVRKILFSELLHVVKGGYDYEGFFSSLRERRISPRTLNAIKRKQEQDFQFDGDQP